MNKRIASFAILGGMVVAAAFAAFQTHASPASTPPSQLSLSVPSSELAPALPPNHPPMGFGNPHGAAMAAPAEEGAAIAWMAPPSWRSIPNTSSMRLATYRIPGVPGDSEDGELSVTRAGGTTEANIQRWLGQFDGSSKESRETRTVQGFDVTVVAVKGTFLGGGMMQSAPSSPRPSWQLLGAIVETPGSSYFFKLLGPASTVNAARAPFDAMVAGLTRL